MITFAVEWQFFPGNPHAGHVTNVLLYAITDFFVQDAPENDGKGEYLLPFIISILLLPTSSYRSCRKYQKQGRILCLFAFHTGSGQFPRVRR